MDVLDVGNKEEVEFLKEKEDLDSIEDELVERVLLDVLGLLM